MRQAKALESWPQDPAPSLGLDLHDLAPEFLPQGIPSRDPRSPFQGGNPPWHDSKQTHRLLKAQGNPSGLLGANLAFFLPFNRSYSLHTAVRSLPHTSPLTRTNRELGRRENSGDNDEPLLSQQERPLNTARACTGGAEGLLAWGASPG